MKLIIKLNSTCEHWVWNELVDGDSHRLKVLAEVSELGQAAVAGDHAVLLLAENALVDALFLGLVAEVGGKEAGVVEDDHGVPAELVVHVLRDAEARHVEENAVLVAHEAGHVPQHVKLGLGPTRGPKEAQKTRGRVRQHCVWCDL